jgi:hypothetical protein
LKPKDSSKHISEFAKAEITLIQNILFALEENVIHQRSKPEDPSMVLNPHQFRPLNDNLIDIAGKKKKLLTCTQETTRAKLE